MNPPLRRLFDAITLPMCRVPLVLRLVGALAYQRKRTTRRAVERRLQASGEYGDVVQRGPFSGLRYLPPDRYASARFEKIIGAYEHEIHGWLAELAATKAYAMIVNVGAAEGFYAAGLAGMFPSARVLAYESEAEGRKYCGDLARLNGLEDRVEIRGTCSMEEFADLRPPEPVLVVMDIDLGERVLLDPQRVAWLAGADILVELHDCLQAGTSDLVRGRFEGSHRIRQVTNAGLAYGDYPCLRSLSFDEIYAMVAEDRRGLQDWFLMEPSGRSA